MPHGEKEDNLFPGDDSTDSSIARILTTRFENWRDARKPIEREWRLAFNNFVGRYKKELKSGEGETWRSRAFFPMTKQKVQSALAQIADSVFQGGKFPFDMTLTTLADSPNEALRDAAFDLEERLDKHKLLITDQLEETNAKKELLDAFRSGAIYGTCCIKSPVIMKRERNRFVSNLPDDVDLVPVSPEPAEPEVPEDATDEQRQEIANEFEGRFNRFIGETEENQNRITQFSTFEMETFTEFSPGIENKDIWDIYIDPETEDVQKGTGVYERMLLTDAELEEMRSRTEPTGEKDEDGEDIVRPVFDNDALTMLILESREVADTTEDDKGNHRERENKKGTLKNTEVFEYSGILSKKDILDGGQAETFGITEKDLEDDIGVMEVIATFSNNKLLRIIENPLPGQIRPFHVSQWERIPGRPYGRGIARNVRDAQSVANGFLRAFIDNKNLAAVLMFAIDEGALAPGTDLKMRPGKNFRFIQGTNLREAFQTITVPDITDNILEGLARAIEFGDQASGVPKIVEGDPGVKNQTAFAAQQQVAAAAKQLGLVIRNYDEMNSSIIRSLYQWNMLHSEDEDIKGDFDIIATGFTSFQSKAIKSISLRNLLVIAQSDPESRLLINTEAIIRELTKLEDLNEEQFLNTPEEVERLREEESKRVQAAIASQAQAEQTKIDAETQGKLQVQQLKGQQDQQQSETELVLKSEMELAKLEQNDRRAG